MLPVLIRAVEKVVIKQPVERQMLGNPIPLTELFRIDKNSQDFRDIDTEGIRFSNAYTV